MKCAYNVISIAKHRDEGQIWKIIWQSEGPQSFHVALTLDANYLRGTIAAIFLILQHSTCPQSLSFHFLLARFEPELISSIKSTFPYLNFKIYGFDSKRVHGKISRSIRQGLDQPLNYAKNLSCWHFSTKCEDGHLLKTQTSLLLMRSQSYGKLIWRKKFWRRKGGYTQSWRVDGSAIKEKDLWFGVIATIFARVGLEH